AFGGSSCRGPPPQKIPQCGMAEFSGVPAYPPFKGELQFSDPEFHKKETTMMGSRNATEEDFAKVGRLMTEGKVTARMMLTHRYDFKSLAEIYESDVINNRQLIKGVIHF
ncbi:hypothetical protein L427_10014, partial [Klebsiella pneumoniae BIDMC 2A]